ncbi:MAG: RNA methyltransferase [Flaviflexus sp.]|nr:RNA methyltransferase [Flaviflexus sp.]
MLITVSGPDSRLADYTELTDVALRRKLETERGLYMAESTNVIMRAIEAGHKPRSFLTAAKHLPALSPWIERATGAADGGEVPVYLADEAALRTITGFHLHRGALAAMNRPVLAPVCEVVADANLIVILEGLVDHTNVGAIFRSAAALGADAVLATPTCADPLYRRSVRVSMGTVFQVPWTRIENWPGGIDQLRAAGFTVASLALAKNGRTLPEFTAALDPADRVALIMGTEGDGLGRRTVEASDCPVRIPMSGGVDSLNVAAASAVAMYAVRHALGPETKSKAATEPKNRI